MSVDRVDLTGVKRSIFNSLADDGARRLYWTTLRYFLLAKRSKAELDLTAKKLLKDKISLHNYFIRGLIANANSAEIPSVPRIPVVTFPSKDESKAKRGKQAGENGLLNKNLGRVPFAAGVGRGVPPNVAINATPPPLALDTQWSANAMELPDRKSLRAKMFKTAKEGGLKDVHEEAVSLMMHSLDLHLKHIITTCLQHSKALKTARARRDAARSLLRKAKGRRGLLAESASDPNNLSVRDLMTSIEVSPYLLGEDLPWNQERISAMQYF